MKERTARPMNTIPETSGSIPDGLPALERALREELATFSYPACPWTVERFVGDEPVLDTLIVGGGQNGIATAARLQLDGVRRVLVVDREPDGDEGPWRTWARMITLRTAKFLHGTDNGYFFASFRSWFISQFGSAAYDELVLIPKELWADYLAWVRRVFSVSLRSETEVVDLRLEGEFWSAIVESRGERSRILTRSVVMCTGIDGNGGPIVPEPFRSKISKSRWRHSSERFDPSELADRRVVVIGAGASAFDNAAAALEAGAASVHHLIRRPKLPEVNTLRFLETRGFFSAFASLPIGLKLAFIRKTFSTPMPPPPWSVERCVAHKNYHLELGAALTAVEERDDEVMITTPLGAYEADLVLFGTGFEQNLAGVPWLRSIIGEVRTWGEIAPLGDDPADRRIAAFPLLGSTMELLPIDGRPDSALSRIRIFNAAAAASIGEIVIGNNGLPWGVRRIADGVVRDLFSADAPEFLAEYTGYAASEFELASLVGRG